MKKIALTALLCAALLLAACANDNTGTSTPASIPPVPTTSQPAATPTPAPSASGGSHADSVASATSEAKTVMGTVISAMVNELEVQLDSGEIYTFTVGDADIEPDGTILAVGDAVTLYYYGDIVSGDIAQSVHVVHIITTSVQPV